MIPVTNHTSKNMRNVLNWYFPSAPTLYINSKYDFGLYALLFLIICYEESMKIQLDDFLRAKYFPVL